MQVHDRRKVKDRRANILKQDQAYKCNRRIRPCRRLNNISVKWIPMDAIKQHPVIWHMFHKLGCALYK
jgi:hypothetical protein